MKCLLGGTSLQSSRETCQLYFCSLVGERCYEGESLNLPYWSWYPALLSSSPITAISVKEPQLVWTVLGQDCGCRVLWTCRTEDLSAQSRHWIWDSWPALLMTWWLMDFFKFWGVFFFTQFPLIFLWNFFKILLYGSFFDSILQDQEDLFFRRGM